MNGFGSIIQFMFFIIAILVMAKIFGFADDGWAVLAACALGGLVYALIYFISLKLRNRKEAKKNENVFKGKDYVASGSSSVSSVRKNKKQNPKKKKSGKAK